MGERSRGRLLRLAANSASLLSTAVVVRAASFLTYVFVARALGAHELGQLTLATSVMMVLLEVVLLGCRRVLVRDLAQQPALGRGAIAAAVPMTLITSAAALLLTWAFVTLMGYAPATSAVILLLAGALWPAALVEVADSVAQGWERSQLTLAVQLPVAVLKVVAVLVVLARGGGVVAVTWVLVGAYALSALLACAVVVARAPRPGAGLERVRPLALARAGMPFLGINLTASLRGNATTLILSGFVGEAAVGLFGAASQLTVPLRLIYDKLVTSFFPAMVRAYQQGPARLLEVSRSLLGMIFALSLPLALLLFGFAEPLLAFVYSGPEFAGAAAVLRLLVWVPVLDGVKGVLGQALWAAGREGLALRVSVVNMVIAVGASLLLIPRFGLMGAAGAAAVVALVNLLQHQLATARSVGRVGVARAVAAPALAALAMAGALYLATPLGPWAALLLAVAAFIASLLALLVLGAGGLAAFQTRYIAPWLR